MRINTNFLVVFKQDYTNLRRIFNDHCSADLDFPEFCKICHLCWNQTYYGLMFIDKNRELNLERYRYGFYTFIKLKLFSSINITKFNLTTFMCKHSTPN